MNSTSSACRTRAARKASRLSRKSATRGFSVLRSFPCKRESSSRSQNLSVVALGSRFRGDERLSDHSKARPTLWDYIQSQRSERTEIADVLAGARRDRDRAGAGRHDLAALQPPGRKRLCVRQRDSRQQWVAENAGAAATLGFASIMRQRHGNARQVERPPILDRLAGDEGAVAHRIRELQQVRGTRRPRQSAISIAGTTASIAASISSRV